MFNMGGPIKQGIMHGIREPYNSGGRIGLQIGGGINAARWLASLAGKTFGKVGQTIGGAGVRGAGEMGTAHLGAGRALATIPKPGWGARIAEKWKGIPSWFRAPIERDPVVGAGRWGVKALTSPTAKGLGQKVFRGVATPTGVGLTAYMFWPDGTKKTKEELKAQGLDQHGPFDHTDKKKIKKAQDAFAEAQRDTRVKKYLDMMGYDRSKKTAVADALIDASKIVSERGSLKGDVTRELINPIIQATSKRFDKPEQIREAVGLMTMKAEIEKDISKEKDALAKSLTMKKIEQLDRQLDSGVAGKLLTYMAAKKGKVKGDELVDFVRLSANEEGKNFTMVTDEQVQAVPGWENKSAEEVISFIAKDDGVYMMGDTVIEVEGGKPTRIK